MAILSSALVGAGFLIAWALTRERWPVGTIFVPRDVPSLALALERAKPGGTIALDARHGPFAGGVSITVPGLTLRSEEGRARIVAEAGEAVEIAADGVTIRGVGFANQETGVSIRASKCLISGVSLTSCATGIEVVDGSENVIEQTSFVGGRVGLHITSSGTEVRDATFRSQSEAGVRIEGVDRCVLQDSRLDACPVGVSVEGGSDVSLSHLEIHGADTAIDLVKASEVRLTACALAASRVGVHLQEAAAVAIESCYFDALTEAGIASTESKRMSVSESAFETCAAGVRASGGGENALIGNCLRHGGHSAIVLQGEGNDLVSANFVRGGDVGITLDRTSSAQVLRNRVEDTLSAGILLDGGDHAQLLDNHVARSAVGMASVASSSSSIRRNTLVQSRTTGLVLFNGTLGSTAAENRITRSGQGMLVAGSSRDVATENEIQNCVTGIALCRIGFGTQIEGNDVANCNVGLLWDDGALAGDFPLLQLGYAVERAESAMAPLLADNAIRSCREKDVKNATSLTLLAGGNRWSPAAPRVEGLVSVPESGWKGSIALGSGTSTADRVLGRLLEWMLTEDGVHVVDLVGLGSDDALLAALGRGDVNAVWWDTGDPPSGLPFWVISPRQGWSLVAKPGLSPEQSAGEASISLAVPSGVATALADDAARKAGLLVGKVESADSSAAAENLLKFGAVDCAVLDRLEETVTLSGYVALDTADALPSSSMGLVVEGQTGDVGSALRATFERLRAHLTDEDLKNLVSRVRLLGRDPLDVAMEYLLREGLIGGSAEGGTP